MPIQMTQVTVNQNDIIFTIGDGTVVYETDINAIELNSGITIKNIDFSSIKGYWIKLSVINKKLICGHILDNIAIAIKKQMDNSLVIIDFSEIEEVSENFLKSYTKFLLETSNKVITINMDATISNDFGNFIEKYIDEVEDE